MLQPKWKLLQRVNIGDETAHCRKCGSGISSLTEFVYDGDSISDATSREELFECTSCGEKFILHYDLFDPHGHVYSRIFTGDPNNLSYNWQDLLTPEQQKAISDHLLECKICQDRLSEETLSDAWFSSFLQDLRRRAGIIVKRRD